MEKAAIGRLIPNTSRGRESLLECVTQAERNAAAVTQFRAMIARAQARPPVAPAVLAQIASQARNLLER